jgi:dihydrofolate reductase
MPRVTIIAAVASNGVIGRGGALPWRIPGDLPRFKAATLGQTPVMGRKTFESIGKALPGRATIVVSRNPSWSAPGVEVARTIQDAIALAKTPEVFIAGGAEIYALALELTDRLLLTEVEGATEGDTFFPELDRSRWKCVDDELQKPSAAFPHVVHYRELVRALPENSPGRIE